MKVKLISKQNPMKREESKFYANPVNIGRKSLSSIATDMAGRSSLTRGDIENVLSNFVDLPPTSDDLALKIEHINIILIYHKIKIKTQNTI